MTDSHAIEAFEGLDVPEGFKAELLWGEIVMMAGPDLVHNEIVEAVSDQIPRERWKRLQTQDVALLSQTSEPQPDLVVLPRDAGPASGRLMPHEEITFLMEVVSTTSGHRDHVTKRALYAAGGVPAYLIVDPFKAECVLLTEPAGKGEQADYRSERRTPFGESVPLELLGVKLETEEFQTLPVRKRVP